MNDAQELFPASAHNRDKPPGKIGGCVGTFLQLFDWNPRKRLFSTKRLPAERPVLRKASSTKKKFKDERMPVAKLLLLAEEENRGGFPSPKKGSAAPSSDPSNAGTTGKRVPGVVARLMGLESLPDEGVNDGRLSPQHPKMLPPVEVRPLQELLHTRQQELSSLPDLLRVEAKKLALTDRLHVPVPGFVKKLPDPGPQANYMPPKDGFKKSLRSDPHIQPYADHKFQKSLRPLKRTPRDLTDPKNLILALSPRSNGDGIRPILLPSKAHNKLMNSPVKSPTKMGSRSARFLEAAVKILEPSMQSSTTRARVPPARPSSVMDYKESEREAGMDDRKEKLSMIERKVALSSNAARALKGQSMNRSWNGNGREETGRNSSSSFHDSAAGRKRNDQSQVSNSKAAAPMRAVNRNRTGKGGSVQEETILRVTEEIKTVVPQGFEETYGGGLRPLNVGRRDETRLDKFDIEDRGVSEKHVISSLSSLSSLSVSNSPYSECSERSSTSSIQIQDPLRRSGSVKDSAPPATPTVSKSRFMRSKSVKDEKSSKSGSGSGSQGLYSRNSTREPRVKQEIPQQAHHLQQQARHQAQSNPAASVESQDSPRLQGIESGSTERDSYQESESKKMSFEDEKEADAGKQLREPLTVQSSPKVSLPDVEMSADESISSSRSSQTTSTSSASIAASGRDAQVPRSSSVGGLLSYSRLFGSRKSGDRKSDRKEKKGQSEAPRKSETSLVRSLLRRKSSSPSPSSPTPAPVQSMEKPKKRGGKVSVSEPPSREMSDVEHPGYFSEDYTLDGGFDLAAALQSKLLSDRNEQASERIIHPDSEVSSPSKSVNDVFPVVPSDRGCLRLLDGIDERGPRRPAIEGFDCVEEDEDDGEDRFRDGLFSYASHLMDDLKLEEMFSTGTAMQGSGRNGFSYSPLVDLDEPPRSSLESFSLEAGAEIEKCVSFLGRTVVPSPEMSFLRREALSQEAEEQDNVQRYDQRSRSPLGMDSEAGNADIDDAKASLLNELSEARKIVDDALEEATERVAKKLANKGRVVLADVDGDEAVCASVVGNDDCGQPSPVSVLDCPFEEDESRSSQGNVHESICETEEDFDEDDEESVMDDLLLESATTVGPRKERKARRTVPLLDVEADIEDDGKSQTEKIVDAILDISRIRCIDPSACGLVVDNSESFQEEEEEYVRKIISVWEVFPEASGNGANAELPIASTLFDRLESQGRASAWKREKDREEFGSPEAAGTLPGRSFKQWQGLWLHRRLLFDCVNESLAYSLKTKYPEPWLGIPILRQPPQGTALVKEVYSEMQDWRDVQMEELDTVIEMDMCRGFGNWCNLNQEMGEIGLEIERTLLRVMIEELVSEIMEFGCLPKRPSPAVALRVW